MSFSLNFKPTAGYERGTSFSSSFVPISKVIDAPPPQVHGNPLFRSELSNPFKSLAFFFIWFLDLPAYLCTALGLLQFQSLCYTCPLSLPVQRSFCPKLGERYNNSPGQSLLSLILLQPMKLVVTACELFCGLFFQAGLQGWD